MYFCFSTLYASYCNRSIFRGGSLEKYLIAWYCMYIVIGYRLNSRSMARLVILLETSSNCLKMFICNFSSLLDDKNFTASTSPYIESADASHAYNMIGLI